MALQREEFNQKIYSRIEKLINDYSLINADEKNSYCSFWW